MALNTRIVIIVLLSSSLWFVPAQAKKNLTINGRMELSKTTPSSYRNSSHKIEARKLVRAERDIVLSAEELSSAIDQDLESLIYADSKENLLDAARRLGNNYKLSFWRNMWAHIVDQHEVLSEGTPLHKVCHLIKKDLESLQKMSKQLYKKGLATYDIFFEIQDQIISLQDMIETIKSAKDFVEESRDTQAYYDRQAQLRESQRQTDELKKINSKPATPTYVVLKKETNIYN